MNLYLLAVAIGYAQIPSMPPPPLDEAMARRAQPVESSASQPEDVMGVAGVRSDEGVPPDKLAMEAGLHWLGLVDANKHEDSYGFTAAFIRDVIPEMKWTDVVLRQRKRLGALGKRETAFVQHASSMVGGPNGRYLLLHFSTTFEERRVIEIVTLYQEADLTWKVAGYAVE
jgi:hypothetical protein